MQFSAESLELNCPQILRDCKQWVAWKFETRDGKPTKVPINPKNGLRASSANPASWGTFEQAVAACQRNTALAGVGFVFAKGGPYCGVDLDNSVDGATGEIKPWANRIVDLLDSYTEISPSGCGLKIFMKATKPGFSCKKEKYHSGAFEVYDHDRFFTVTASRVSGTPCEVNDRQTELASLYWEVFGRQEPKAQQAAPCNGSAGILSDDEILRLCRGAKNSQKFNDLFAGQWENRYGSQSQADFALVSMLAFYTQVGDQIDRIFRQSLLLREKWDQPSAGSTYGRNTIAKILDGQTTRYEGRGKMNGSHSLADVNGQLQEQADEPDVVVRSNGKEEKLPFSIDWELKTDQFETSMAREFVALNHENLRYIPAWKEYYAWDGKRWKIDHGDMLARSLVINLVKGYEDRLPLIPSEKRQKVWASFCSRASRKSTIENILSLAKCDKRILILDYEIMNRDPYLLNVQNGTLDLKKWKFREHKQSDLITVMADAEYVEGAECPDWNKFINFITKGDMELARYLQALLGYSCSGDVGEHILPICYGTGANGKSTLWNAVVEMLGEYAHVASNKLLMGSTNEHPTIIASLYKKRLVTISEPEEGSRLRESTVKELTGDARITCRKIRQDEWSFNRTHKLWMATNHLPQIHGTDDGIWRRIKAIPFRADVREGREVIPDYHKVLVDKEGPGILNWLLAGFFDWKENGFIVPQSVRSETQAYRGDSDELGRFIGDCCEVSSSRRVCSAELYDAYRTWGGKMSQTRFSQSMRERFTSTIGWDGAFRGRRVFEGIDLHARGEFD